MARFNIIVSHALPEGEALRRLHGEIENLKRQYGDKISNLRDSWNSETYGFEGMAMGFAVSGTMTVKPSHLEVPSRAELKRPFGSEWKLYSLEMLPSQVLERREISPRKEEKNTAGSGLGRGPR